MVERCQCFKYKIIQLDYIYIGIFFLSVLLTLNTNKYVLQVQFDYNPSTT